MNLLITSQERAPKLRGPSFVSPWGTKLAAAILSALLVLGPNSASAASTIRASSTISPATAKPVLVKNVSASPPFRGTSEQWLAVQLGKPKETKALLQLVQKKANHIVYGDAAQDVAQEATFKLVQKAGIFAATPPSHLQAFVSTTVRRASIDYSTKFSRSADYPPGASPVVEPVLTAAPKAEAEKKDQDGVSFAHEPDAHWALDPARSFEIKHDAAKAREVLTSKQINLLILSRDEGQSLSAMVRNLGVTRYDLMKQIDQASKDGRAQK